MRRGLAILFLGVLALGLPRPASAQFGPPPSFAAPTSIPLNTNPHFIAVGDLNKDGNSDLVIGIEATIPSSLYVLLGNGAGGFTAAPGSPVNVDTFPVSIAIADLNNDTNPDVVVANSASTSSNLSVLRGDGTGALTNFPGSPIPLASGAMPYWVVVANMNADAFPDLITANNGTNNVSVLLGVGDGTFGAPVYTAAGNMPRSVAVADFDLDGFKDLAVANFNDQFNAVMVFKGTVSGTAFGPPTSYGGDPVDQGARSIVLTDLNGDTHLDIVTAHAAASFVSVWQSNGNGTFQNVGRHISIPNTVGSGAFMVNSGDFNGDGKKDIVVTNLNTSLISIMNGDGSGGLQAPKVITSATSTLYPAVGRFDAGTSDDLVVSNYGAGNAMVFLNTPGVLADVAVALAGPATATAGGPIAYTVTLTNNGPAASADVWLQTFTPPGLAFVSGTGPCATLPCHVGPVPAGPFPAITLNYAIDPGFASPNAQTAVAMYTPTGDAVPANDSASVTTPILPAQVDLVVTKTGPATIVAGQDITYAITVNNNGPNAAGGVVLSDPAPANLTFKSITGGGCATLPCTIGTVAVGANLPITATFTVSPDYTGGGSFTNTATVTTVSNETVPGDNSVTSAATTVSRSADLGVNKTGPASIFAGQNLVYTITVSNDGPSSATGATVANPTPAGLTFVSASNGCNFPVTPNCSLGTVAPGPGTPFTVTYSVPADYSGVSPIVNVATVSTTTSDPDSGNNTDSVSTTVGFSANLEITKTGPATVARGEDMTYTIAVRNIGPSNATSVSVVDTTPAGLTFVSTSAPCAVTTSFPCALGTITPGQTKTFTATFHVPTGFGAGPINNTATVSSAVNDPTPGNNSDSAQTTVVTSSSSDLIITKTGPANVYRGQQGVTYTITVMNNGPSTAANVQVADPTPAGLVFVSNTGDCTAAFPCSLGTLGVGVTRTITAKFDVPVDYAGSIPVVNTATVTSTTADPNTSNNSSSASAGVGFAFYTVSPCRLVDTREVANAPALAPGTVRTFTLVGTCGVTSGARSVSVNITVTSPTDAGDLRIYPTGTPLPGSSAINFAAGQTRANNAIIPLGAGGAIDVVTSQAAGSVQFILDVNGFLAYAP